jgi:alkylhydroperoxidase family enzyme
VRELALGPTGAAAGEGDGEGDGGERRVEGGLLQASMVSDGHNPGMPTNYERAFTERPEVLEAWGQLNGAIKAGMDLRRYELATLAAARRLRSTYCSLAHGTVLLDVFGEPVREIALDRRSAGLDEVDLAVMDFAEKVVGDAAAIQESDLQPLRDLGLSDTDIMNVALAAAARCFFSKTLDAMGVLPDASYRELEPELQEALVVGRPIAES